LVEWSLCGSLSELCPTTLAPTKMAAITKNITECKHRLVTYHKTQNGKCCWHVMSVVHYRIQVAIFPPKWLLLQCEKPFFQTLANFGEWTKTKTHQNETHANAPDFSRSLCNFDPLTSHPGQLLYSPEFPNFPRKDLSWIFMFLL
jgi:hypothetical protein